MRLYRFGRVLLPVSVPVNPFQASRMLCQLPPAYFIVNSIRSSGPTSSQEARNVQVILSGISSFSSPPPFVWIFISDAYRLMLECCADEKNLEMALSSGDDSKAKSCSCAAKKMNSHHVEDLCTDLLIARCFDVVLLAPSLPSSVLLSWMSENLEY